MWKFAIRNLFSRPARSALSLLGLTVAIAGMVGLFSVARGLEQTFDRSFKGIPGMVVVQAGAPLPLFSKLPTAWKEDIEKLPGVHVVAPEVWLRANIIEDKPVMAPPRILLGVDIPSRLKLRKGVYTESMVEGRFLAPEDCGKRIVVISRQIADEHHKKIGDSMEINGVEFEIAGVYHIGSLLLDVAILVDGETLRHLGWFDAQGVSGFYIESDLGASNEEVSQRVRDLLQDRTLTTPSPMSFLALAGLGSPSTKSKPESGGVGSWLLKALAGSDRSATLEGGEGEATDHSDSTGELSPSVRQVKTKRPSPVEVRNASDFSERFKEMGEDLNLILTVLTGIGMTIAVLSIVNTMLMSVAERVIEFGILKANGWSPWDVLQLITVESATLGLGGGVLGAFIGWLATCVINTQWPDRVNLFASPGLLVFSVAFSVVVGLLGGLYPAVWAMRLSPMEAIRRS
jgi:putative ABC transport system permease protein